MKCPHCGEQIVWSKKAGKLLYQKVREKIAGMPSGSIFTKDDAKMQGLDEFGTRKEISNVLAYLVYRGELIHEAYGVHKKP